LLVTREEIMKLTLQRVLAGAWIALSGAAFAQGYPSKPVRILTSAPAGPYDIMLRAVTPALQASLGQSVVIDNRVGANYVPLAEACAKAAPDGYTLCTADLNANVLNLHAYSKLPFAAKDFAPIVHYGYLYSALIVHPSVPASSLKELLALAKAKPGAINFASPGPASTASMYVEYWKNTGVATFQNVGYKSFVQALNAVVAGEVQVSMFALGGAMAQARAGKVKALAIVGLGRSKLAPDVPTFREAGMELTLTNFGGMLGPSGLPADIVGRWNGEFRKLLADPVLREKAFEAQGFEQQPPSGGTPEQFASFLEAENQKIAKVVQAIGLKLD
jgi:tripartite-type tricarboxylate transporter receptor subunit TctC